MRKDKIVLPKKTYDAVNYSVAITPEAVTALQKITSKTSLSARKAASIIIIQAIEKNLISFEGDEDE